MPRRYPTLLLSFLVFATAFSQNKPKLVVGIVVDAVSDVIALKPDQMRPAPDFAASVDTAYIMGLGALGDRMLIVMDIEKLMLSGEMALVDEAAH